MKSRGQHVCLGKIKPEHLKGEGTIDFCLRMMMKRRFRFHLAARLVNGEGFVRIALVENDQR